jgi:hypothetical protein
VEDAKTYADLYERSFTVLVGQVFLVTRTAVNPKSPSRGVRAAMGQAGSTRRIRESRGVGAQRGVSTSPSNDGIAPVAAIQVVRMT